MDSGRGLATCLMGVCVSFLKCMVIRNFDVSKCNNNNNVVSHF